MCQILYTAYDIAKYLIEENMSHKQSLLICDWLWRDRQKLLDSDYDYEKRIFKQAVSRQMERMSVDFCETEGINRILKDTGSDFSITSTLDVEINKIKSYFCVMKLKLTYTGGTNDIRMKFRTLLREFGYERRSQNFNQNIKNILEKLGLVAYLKGKRLCDFATIELDDMVIFRLSTTDNKSVNKEKFMATGEYDYISAKRRIEKILDDELEVIKDGEIPKNYEFGFNQAYLSQVSCVVVNMRRSTAVFLDENHDKVTKLMRSYVSEIIEILKDSDKVREVGIIGDCVYAVYTTPTGNDMLGLMDKVFYVNTFIMMLNELLKEKDYPLVSVGIGVSTGKELVARAGSEGSVFNSKIWIGKVFNEAWNLSSLGGKNGLRTIVCSGAAYDYFILYLSQRNEKAHTWFKVYSSTEYGRYHDANINKKPYKNWVIKQWGEDSVNLTKALIKNEAGV